MRQKNYCNVRSIYFIIYGNMQKDIIRYHYFSSRILFIIYKVKWKWYFSEKEKSQKDITYLMSDDVQSIFCILYKKDL